MSHHQEPLSLQFNAIVQTMARRAELALAHKR